MHRTMTRDPVVVVCESKRARDSTIRNRENASTAMPSPPTLSLCAIPFDLRTRQDL